MSWLEREANLTLSAVLKASASNTYKYLIHNSLPLSKPLKPAAHERKQLKQIAWQASLLSCFLLCAAEFL